MFTFNEKKITAILEKNNISQNFELALFLAKKMRDYYVYNTAGLEGNTMTYPEVQTLLEGITVGGHKLTEEQQILNQNESWLLLLSLLEKRKFSLEKEIFFRLHNKVAYREALRWGEFRDKQVRIGGTDYKPPLAEDLNFIFEEGLGEIKKVRSVILRAVLIFLFLARNQFFFDGNKRLGRLMMNGVLLSGGYPILNILVKDKLRFNELMIDFYDSGDASEVLIFLLEFYFEVNGDYDK